MKQQQEQRHFSAIVLSLKVLIFTMLAPFICAQTAAAAPPVPTNLSPDSTSSNGLTLRPSDITFFWDNDQSAAWYNFEISDIATNEVIHSDNLHQFDRRNISELQHGKSYSWKVRACNQDGCSGFTSPQYFETTTNNSYVRNIVVDLEGFPIFGGGNGANATISSRSQFGFQPVTMGVDDNLILNIDFAGSQRLALTDDGMGSASSAGNERLFVFLGQEQNNAIDTVYLGTISLVFKDAIGDSVDKIESLTGSACNSGIQCGLAFVQNLTSSSVSFSGFSVEFQIQNITSSNLTPHVTFNNLRIADITASEIDILNIPPPPICGVLSSGIDTCVLEKGDILLGLNENWTGWSFNGAVRLAGGTYFQHAAIYIGDGKVSEATGQQVDPDDEVKTSNLMDPDTYWNNNEILDWAIIRPIATSDTIEAAVDYAQGKADQGNQSITPGDTRDRILYNVFFGDAEFIYPDKYDEDKFYCSQLVWRSYFNQGLDLETDPGEISPLAIINLFTLNLVSPDDLFYSAVDNPFHNKKADKIAEKLSGLGNKLNRFLFRVFSPVDIMLIDAQGRRTGYDPATNEFLTEIPGTTYTGPDEEPEAITYTGTESEFSLLTTGNDYGAYTLQVMSLDEVNPSDSYVSKVTEPSAMETFIIQMDRPSEELLLLNVEIDIKPGGKSNTVNLKSSGVTSVAIYSTDVFDATTLDPESLLLSGSKVKAKRKANKYSCHEIDANNDDLDDFVCKFYTGMLNLDSDATNAFISGKTYDGIQVIGSDFIRIIPSTKGSKGSKGSRF